VTAKKPRARDKVVKGDDTFVIGSVETLRAFADPLRLRLLLLAEDEPRTVKEMAEALGAPQTRLYYHVRILEQAGILRVTSRRMVSGIEERRYQAVASNWTAVAPSVAAALATSGILKAILDLIAAEIAVALRLAPEAAPGDADGPLPHMILTRLALDRDEVEDVQRRIDEIANRYGETRNRPKQGKPEYHAFFTVYATPSPPRPDGAKKKVGRSRRAV
jgi:DNA-binding transcriptional ArsR family regulator